MHLNPFDLPDPARARPDALTRRALFAHTVIAVLTGAEPAPAEKAALDKAIMAAYHHAGITSDQRTWARPAPLLADLAAALRADGTPPAVTLADRLVPYTERHPLRLVLRADHDPPRRAPGRVQPAGPARGTEGHRDAAGPGRDLAAGLGPGRPGTAAADHRR